MRKHWWPLVLFAGIAAGFGDPVAAAGIQPRPDLEVAAATFDCPGISGSFVALLDPDRGMLLLSAAPFPGGREQAVALGGAARLLPEGAEGWTLDWVEAADDDAGLWAAVYPWRGQGVTGCVAFTKQRFSSEGDLVTYLRWLAEEVYASLPVAERQAWPALRLGNRKVRLRVEREGHTAITLEGREASTLAFRFSDSDRVYLVLPFVLDPATARVALRLSYTDEEIWGSANKPSLGQVVAAVGAPAQLADPPLTLVIEEVGVRAE